MKLLQNIRFRLKSNCKAVFIMGCPRSGTTLAKRYLGTHPDCKIAPYVGLYRPLESDVARVYKVLALNKATVFKQTGWVVSRENWHPDTTAIPFLSRTFPNSYFIVVVRHPSASLASLKETDRHPEVPKDDGFSDWWVDLYQETLGALQGQKHLIIRYEDLVQEPIRVKKLFCEFLRIDPEKMPHDTSYELPDTGDPSVHVYEDSKCLQTNTIHTASLDRRDPEMVVSTRLREFARRFQYDDL